MRNAIFSFMFMVLSLPSLANTNSNKEITIPFIVNQKLPAFDTSYQILNIYPMDNTQETTKEVNAVEFKELIIKVQRTICSAINTGSVKVWIGVDVSGKILGVGASGQSGIEVTFQCK